MNGITRIRYEFVPDDAYRFARENGYKVTRNGDELMFRLCPFCGGGNKPDRGTFSINLKTGMYKCLRATCGARGNMITLAQNTGFTLSGMSGEFYTAHKQYRKLPQPKEPYKPKPPAIAYLRSRGISEETATRYEITTQTDHDNILVFPFYDESGELVTVKYRKTDFDREKDKNKEWFQKDTKPILFGMKQCDFNNPVLIITEGQMDSLSVADCGFTNAVSVPNGAVGFKWVIPCWDFMHRFNTIIVFGDHEKGHITLLDDIIARFRMMKVMHVREEDYLDCKDANDILRKYGKEQIVKCIENAKEVPISTVKDLADVGQINIFDTPKLKTGIGVLDRLLYGGLPFGGITLIAGKPGEGKSTLASQIVVNAIQQGHTVFAYSGELPNELFRAWMDFQVAGTNAVFQYQTKYGDTGYNISGATRNMISDWYRGKIYVYDATGVDDETDGLLKTTERMILRNGCDVILIDNLMTALDLEAIDERDKYERQSKFVKSLTRLALTYKVLILLVAHKRKNNFSQNENDEISGSGDIANLGMVTLAYEKNGDLAPEQRLLKVSKNRLFGKTNTEGWTMEYDERSKRIYNDISELGVEFSWNTLNNGFMPINMEIGDEDNEIPF